MIWELIFTFFLSVLASFFVIVIVKKLFVKLDFLDNPQKYGKKRAPIPYSMGVIFFLTFFLISYFFVEHTYKLSLLWLFGGLITLVSFIDDRLNISPKLRLCMQVIIGAIIGLTAIKVWYVSGIFWGVIDLQNYFIEFLGYKIFLVSLIFTIVWYVFIFNVVNWTDGIPGNTSGLSIISFFIIFLLGLKLYLSDTYTGGIENAQFIMSLSLILIWILLPFFYFDVKEKFLMWDTGTMFLGFMLWSMAIISWGKIGTVLLVFWVYSIDALYVIFQRIQQKKNPLIWDRNHLHHRLLAIWLSHKKILSLLFIASFLFWVTSLFLGREGKIFVFVIIFFFVIFIPKILLKYKKNEKD